MTVSPVFSENSDEFIECQQGKTLKKRQLCFKRLARSLQKELDAQQEEQLDAPAYEGDCRDASGSFIRQGDDVDRECVTTAIPRLRESQRVSGGMQMEYNRFRRTEVSEPVFFASWRLRMDALRSTELWSPVGHVNW